MWVQPIRANRRSKLRPRRVVEVIKAKIRLVRGFYSPENVNKKPVGRTYRLAFTARDALNIQAYSPSDASFDAVDLDVGVLPVRDFTNRNLSRILLVIDCDLCNPEVVSKDPFLIDLGIHL